MNQNKWHGNAFKKTCRNNGIIIVKTLAFGVEADAKRLCPVDTGNLRASIHTIIYENAISAKVGSKVFYAPFVEFGTYKMKARPFLRPALDMAKTRFNQMKTGNLKFTFASV